MLTDTLSPKQAHANFGALKHQSMNTYMQFEDMNTGGVWRPETVDGDLVRYPSSFLVSNPRLTATIISWRFLSIPSRGYGRRLAVLVAAIWGRFEVFHALGYFAWFVFTYVSCRVWQPGRL